MVDVEQREQTGSGRVALLSGAADAVAELVALITSPGVAGWSFRAFERPLLDVDLRGPAVVVVDGGEDGGGRRVVEIEVEVVPVVLPDGRPVGTIRCPAQPTGAADDALLRALLGTVVLLVAMERKGFAAVDRATTAERESRLDALTGLPNRRLWDEQVAREQARCARHSLEALVAVVDLDDLKRVNDVEGHLAGDVLIRVAAEALRGTVRETDVVARLGGDEFGVLAVAFDDQDGDADRFLDRIEKALAAAGVAASVGVSVATPSHSIAATFEDADRRMLDIKRSRKPHPPEPAVATRQ